MRWQHPEQGIICPGHFISYAESSGQIEQIGAWVLREACERISAWKNQGVPLKKLAVNVSGIQIHRRSLGKFVPGLLRETGGDPRVLELELTESVLMEEPEMSVKELKQLQEMGVSIAIDDFGTGYSSLSYLKAATCGISLRLIVLLFLNYTSMTVIVPLFVLLLPWGAAWDLPLLLKA